MRILRRHLNPVLSRREAEKDAVNRLIIDEFGADTILSYAPDGHPELRVAGRTVSISISHCRDEAVVAVSNNDSPVGIDIETAREQLMRVAPKFLTPDEMVTYAGSIHKLLRAWTTKEAVYKAALTPGLPLHEIRLDTPVPGLATARGEIYVIHHHVDTPERVITTATRSESQA